ncbi:MAG: 50S ribosomal protein L28 [Pirellulaceae bacterium]
MARVCEICGKGTQVGNAVETRGKAKYLGGVGTKVTGITRRKFKPNLQRVRITTAGGTNRTARVCAQCLRSGGVQRVVRQKPFNLPTAEKVKAKAKAKAKP